MPHFVAGDRKDAVERLHRLWWGFSDVVWPHDEWFDRRGYNSLEQSEWWEFGNNLTENSRAIAYLWRMMKGIADAGINFFYDGWPNDETWQRAFHLTPTDVLNSMSFMSAAEAMRFIWYIEAAKKEIMELPFGYTDYHNPYF